MQLSQAESVAMKRAAPTSRVLLIVELRAEIALSREYAAAFLAHGEPHAAIFQHLTPLLERVLAVLEQEP